MQDIPKKQIALPRWLKIDQLDPILMVALVAGLIFGIYGITWGNGESWNPDEMALRDIFSSKTLPFEPTSFYKPPFHTYFNYFLCVYPIELILNKLWLKILWSRMLTIFLFLGSIILVFQISKRFYGLNPARIITLLFATSAGFVVEAHFLTADMPVLFWMLVAFYWIQSISLNGSLFAYLGAGFFTGIATATKYNGLGVGIAIAIAHLLRYRPLAWKSAIFDSKIYLGLAMVVVGFLIGNPFAVISYQKFIANFWYNYQTTPVFDGSGAENHSYGDFLWRFTEIIGLPATILFAIAFCYSLYYLVWGNNQGVEKQGIVLLLSVCLLYYYKFGDFPRIETRFVMPIVPFLMMMAGSFLQSIQNRKKLMMGVLVVLVGYNVMCSLYVGKRFAEDPRMAAQVWVKKHISVNSTIESTGYNPNFKTIPKLNLEVVKTPSISGRRLLFEEAFKGDPWMLDRVREREHEVRVNWYSQSELITRNPDYIAVNSLYYERFNSGKVAALYPSINQFFQDLLAEKYPYKIVFDQTAQNAPPGFYADKILFVDNRITILQRKDNS